jgi:hypothetical protein
MDEMRWGFALVLAGGVVAAYLVNQVPLVAVAMALVALVGLLTAAHGGSWWLRAAVLGAFVGIFVETLRAVVGTSPFDPVYALVFGVVVTVSVALFERASGQAEPS